MFVISGVTGKTGAVAAQALIDQGQPVRVIVRSAEKGRPWQEKGCDVAVADLGDLEAMTQALEGASAAYFLLPPDLSNEDFLGDSQKRSETIVTAATRTRLPHAVILSSVGAQFETRVGPISTVAHLEKLFLNAAIPLSAIRPGYFLENILDFIPAAIHEGIYPSMILPLDLKIDMVATHDIGLCIAEALVNPSPVPHRIIELKGAETYSANDIATALSNHLNKKITAVALPQETWIDTLVQNGLSKQAAGAIAEMHESINNGRISFLDENAKKAEVDLAKFVKNLVA